MCILMFSHNKCYLYSWLVFLLWVHFSVEDSFLLQESWTLCSFELLVQSNFTFVSNGYLKVFIVPESHHSYFSTQGILCKASIIYLDSIAVYDIGPLFFQWDFSSHSTLGQDKLSCHSPSSLSNVPCTCKGISINNQRSNFLS